MTSRKVGTPLLADTRWTGGWKGANHRTDFKVQDFPPPVFVAPSTAGTQTTWGLAVVIAA
ncbi:hypothetical protein N7447_002967 [Penicillium robsamsonii]|uniref:uncharacterized protein n=1 Tax=Penicillium robsamsonii TaxID=1792511 RepID=UPI00254676FA|nr:uncharacterized protein N7447_002967 [Penicillium robsamsonii]KAJ5836941.1 hypothetical protein N7447_002967 [Penicillium robsamsonii]